MFTPICIIDFSGSEIIGSVTLQEKNSIDRWQPMQLRLPWNVGFQEQADGTLRTFFNEALEQLDPTTQDVIQFLNLEDYLPQITDEQTLTCLFGAFVEEIFCNRMPMPEEATTDTDETSTGKYELYLIIPSCWFIVHRNKLRQLIKEEYSPNRFKLQAENKPSILLRACVPEVLCYSIYSLFDGEISAQVVNTLHQYKSMNLFIFVLKEYEWLIWAIHICENDSERLFEIRDGWRYGEDIVVQASRLDDAPEKLTKDLRSFIDSSTQPDSPTFIGGFECGVEENQPLLDKLTAYACQKEMDFFRFEKGKLKALQGAEILIEFFSEQTSPLEKPLHCRAPLCLGVQLPDFQFVEIISKQTEPPCKKIKGFQITTSDRSLDFTLFCGFSLTPHSMLTPLATLSIQPKISYRQSTHEVIVEVDLETNTKGLFSIFLPQEGQKKSDSFILTHLFA